MSKKFDVVIGKATHIFNGQRNVLFYGQCN